ncbi:SipW-dependent-type signal peptide-containing protein [Halobacterium litoreum]|uniref:SipW-dependent-type signal peptide-containing protein n=1 Tax=Halobacterium litoreum TaxID=2039234 RepID=A0ABD5NCI2_9EURY|nr:SipW-dependent-type signal peptide-containing protein [Halobacterium litoreum]UHH14244.1 SipW-dependent-type signal peptide-containing protein [Halobacterium litoreum]
MSDDKFQLSRRRVLAGLGGIGAGAALGGTGTMAFLSDEESSEGNMMTAGTLDLKLDWEHYYHGNKHDRGWDKQPPTNDAGPMFELDDVKPGDWGCGVVSVHLSGNPAHVWFRTSDVENHEHGRTEPEYEVDDTKDKGELAKKTKFVAFPLGCFKKEQNAQALIDADSRPSMDEFTMSEDGDGEYCYYKGSMKDALYHFKDGKYLGAKKRNRVCYFGFCWKVPKHVGNVIQGDSLSFDMDFYAEQKRHNRNPDNPWKQDGLRSCDGNGVVDLPVSQGDLSVDATHNDSTTSFMVEVPDGVFPDGSPDTANHAEIFLGDSAGNWVTQLRYSSASDGNVPYADGSRQENGGSWEDFDDLGSGYSTSAGDDQFTITVPSSYLADNEICALGLDVTKVDGDANSISIGSITGSGDGKPWDDGGNLVEL